MPKVTIHHNPFYLDRNIELFEIDPNITISGFIANNNISFKLPTLCFVNGEPLLRENWVNTYINDNIISFVSLPQGGGGGGSKILRTVMMVAVMIAAPYMSAPLAGQMGMTSAIGQSLLTAGIALSGAALVNVLVPPPSSVSAIKTADQASPTYSLTAQGNSARLGEPIPVIYGRHIIYPDFASTPYTEFIDNEQFLYQLHVIGQGEYTVEQIRIEDTPISSFQEISYEIIPPGGNVTILEPDIAVAPEVAGQEIIEDDYIGPFVANPAETETDELSIDIILPKGLYYSNDSGTLSSRTVTWKIEARLIDDEGEPLSDWVILSNETITDATNSAIRKTYKYPVAQGRYEVQIIRTGLPPEFSPV